MGRSSERTWLVGILRHKILDHLRKVRRDPAVGTNGSANGTSDSTFDRRGHWRVGPAYWGRDPSSEMETRGFGCLLRVSFQAPAGDSPTRSSSVNSTAGAEEVQEILGITPANFWKRLHRRVCAWTVPRVRLVSAPEEHIFTERSVPLMSRLKTFWCLLNLPCDGMSRLASESLDRDLGRMERVGCGRICSTAPPAAGFSGRSSSCGAR